MNSVTGLPSGDQLKKLLGLSNEADFSTQFEKVLLGAARQVFARGGKKIRAQMVQFGYQVGACKSENNFDSEDLKNCELGALIIESLHAGSLIVDDIQDGSQVRRGEPTLHLQVGMPLALNVGNWMYFWPMELIRTAQLDPTVEIELYRSSHRTLLRAHFGQALDIGTSMDQVPRDDVAPLCLASLELKTGALMSLAIEIGAILAKADLATRDACQKFGHEFGVALQMFDDLGNLVFRDESQIMRAKQLEDLYLKRPSWVWASCAKLGQAPFEAFKQAVANLPDETDLRAFLETTQLRAKAKHEAVIYLAQIFEEFENSLGEKTNSLFTVLQGLRALGERMAKAYD
jgi:geranylgeranyl pyrophosphate synthase